jgi:hypothetical protein
MTTNHLKNGVLTVIFFKDLSSLTCIVDKGCLSIQVSWFVELDSTLFPSF